MISSTNHKKEYQTKKKKQFIYGTKTNKQHNDYIITRLYREDVSSLTYLELSLLSTGHHP